MPAHAGSADLSRLPELLTAQTDPQDPLWGALDLPLRAGISRVVTGEIDAKSALDTVARNWQRIMRRGAAL